MDKHVGYLSFNTVSSLKDISCLVQLGYCFLQFPIGYDNIVLIRVILEIWEHGHKATTKSDKAKKEWSGDQRDCKQDRNID